MADSRDAEELFWVEPRQPRDHSARCASTCRARSAGRSAPAASPSPSTAPSPASSPPAPTARRPGSTRSIEQATLGLHAAGHAHSIECWRRRHELVGGLYGVKLGRAFFGESMFSRQTDASKVALAWLVARLRVGDFTLLDCQFMTDAPRLARRGRRSRATIMSALLACGARRRAARRGGAAASPARRRWSAADAPARFRSARPVARAAGAAGAGGPGGKVIVAALGPDVVDRVLDDVERRRFLVEPAGEDPLPVPVGPLHIELDEGAGQLLRLPRRGRLAGAQAGRSTSLTRIAWPGFSVRSRTMPLRLLSKPSTATRCAIGVTPG